MSVLAVSLLGGCGLVLDSDALLARAQKARDRGDWRAASLDLKNALRKNPDNPHARLLLGEASLELGDVPTAIHELEVARSSGVPTERYVPALARSYLTAGRTEDALTLLRTIPTLDRSARLLALQGHALMQRGDEDEARASYEKSLAIDSSDVESLLGMADLSMFAGDTAGALAFTDRARTSHPADARVALARGRLLLTRDEYEQAGAEFERAAALALDRARPDQRFAALLGMTDVHLARRHVDEALGTSERLMQQAPHNAAARYQRARALFASGDLVGAQQLLEANMTEGGNVTASRLLLGAVNIAAGKFEQADATLSAVLIAEPQSAIARQLLAEARLRQRKPAEALEALRPVIEGKDASPQQLALAGRASLLAGETATGLSYLERSAKADPDAVVRRLQLAAAYLASGEVERAREALGSVPDTPGYEAQRLYLDVLTLLAKPDVPGALQLAEDAAARLSTDVAVQSLTAAVLANQRQFERARPYFERAIALQPESADVVFNLGRFDATQGRREEARKHFVRALELDPGHPASTLALAALELDARRSDAALEVLTAAVKARPDFLQARMLAIRVLTQTGRLDRAEFEAREAVRTAPESVPARYELARVLAMSGREGEARRAADAVLAKDGSHVPATELLGRLAMKRGDLDELKRHAAALLRSAPEQGGIGLMLGLAHMLHQTDRAAAERAYQDILQHDADHPVALNNLAWLLQERGDTRALAFARRAHEAAPQDVRITDTYAWLLIERGQVKEGLALLEPIAGDDADPEIRLHRAIALSRLGRSAEARAAIVGLDAASFGESGARGLALFAELDAK